MLTFDEVTRGTLSGATSLDHWADLFIACLGDNRRLRCYKDANGAAKNPQLTGYEFRNVGSTGAMKKVAGRIKKLGRIKDLTVSLAATMGDGASVLRIEGNGRWAMGTLGLSVAAQVARGTPKAQAKQYDFVVSGDFTTTNSIGVTANFSVSGYHFLKAGTGPGAPDLDANAPYLFEGWDWSNPNNPVLAGTTTLDVRDENFVFEDAEMAEIMGDCAVYHTQQGVFLGTGDDRIEFGFMLLASHAANTKSGTGPLYEVTGSLTPRSSWTDYPGNGNYDQTKHNTFPPPFKFVMKNRAGAVLHTFEMRDGLPINGHPCGTSGYDQALPVRPYFNCGMQLEWENTPQAMSPKATKWYPGMTSDGMRPSRGKTHFTVNGVEPMITGGYQGNSRNDLHCLYFQDEWPRKFKDRPQMTGDPYMPPNFYQNDGSADSSPWMDGWKKEPASYTGHNWYTGPGGPRFDRAFIPSIAALWVSDPNGSRLAGSVKWEDMARESFKAYHNHSNHWVTDPHRQQLLNEDNDIFEWRMTRTYYDSRPVYGPKVIALYGDMRDGDNESHKDKNGRFIFSGWSRDSLHSYGSAGWAALLMRSFKAAIASKFDTFYQFCACGDGRYNFRSDYMVRSQAWLWLHYTLAWKLASTHRLGFSRAQLVSMFLQHLEYLYRDVYEPTFVKMEDSDFCNGIRNLGSPTFRENGRINLQGAGLGYYMSGVLALMKQTGFWHEIYSKGGNIKTVLDMHIRNMDLACFGRILDTASINPYPAWPDGDGVPASWADYSAKYEQGKGLSGLFHNDDGSVSNDREVNVHPMAMYPYVRRDFFPELANPRLAPAVAAYDRELGAVTAFVAAADSPTQKRERDHIYGYPGVSIIKAPAVLGPA